MAIIKEGKMTLHDVWKGLDENMHGHVWLVLDNRSENQEAKVLCGNRKIAYIEPHICTWVWSGTKRELVEQDKKEGPHHDATYNGDLIFYPLDETIAKRYDPLP